MLTPVLLVAAVVAAAAPPKEINGLGSGLALSMTLQNVELAGKIGIF